MTTTDQSLRSMKELRHEIDSLYFAKREAMEDLQQEVLRLTHLQETLRKDAQKLQRQELVGMGRRTASQYYIDVSGECVHITSLNRDIFSLMKVSSFLGSSWFYSVGIFLIQLLLLTMVLVQQSYLAFVGNNENAAFGIPYQTDWFMNLGRSLAIIVTVANSRDLFIPIHEVSILWFTNVQQWSTVAGVGVENSTLLQWMVNIALPDLLQFAVGCLSLIISFIIIVQSDNVIILFAEFAAMTIIAEIDDIGFWFAENGYLSEKCRQDIKKVKEFHIEDKSTGSSRKLPRGMRIKHRSVFFVFLLIMLLVPFILIVHHQRNASFFRLRYPGCDIQFSEIALLGNEHCDGGFLNSYQCRFDGNDCVSYNIAYPTCNALSPSEVGDGVCQEEHNHKACGFDGGDCCPVKDSIHLGDGVCHGGWFNTATCLYDYGDCDEVRKEFPSCPDYEHFSSDKDRSFNMTLNAFEIHNGICDNDKQYMQQYFNEECGWVFGDCLNVRERDLELRVKYPKCGVTDYFRIGDGRCDRGEYITQKCGWDEYDCCLLDNTQIGNGECFDAMQFEEAQGTYLSRECGYDGLDCCPFKQQASGNGICFDEVFFLNFMFVGQCAFDNMDCEVNGFPECTVAIPGYLGNGKCQGGDYNTEACGWDGGT